MIKAFSVIATVVIMGLLASGAGAQSIQVGQGRDQKSIRMVRTDTPPVIDGVLDDAVWENAAVVDEFHQLIPIEYAEPSERTEVRILYDDNALYVGVMMYIDPSLITANVLKQNTGYFNVDDFFSISFDSFNTKRGGYWFAVNPNGVRVDGLYRNISQFYSDWDSIYFAETSIVENGWIAEFEIPTRSISFNPNNDTWGMNFSRRIQSRNEQMVWVSNDRRYDPSSAGLATGLVGMNQGVGLDIVPSVSTTQEKNFSSGVSDTNFRPSLDVFYKLTTEMNASLTANTDFSATEVDDRQVNLTRFSLFFPEKRDFFLREADIFEFGRLNQNGRPFFSRRIGLGQGGQLRDLELGGKISGRIGDWDIGALSIRQEGRNTVNDDTLSIVRVRKGLFSESYIGTIFTEGDPNSNVDNSLAGLDFLYRNSNAVGDGRIFEVSTWLQQSDTEGIKGDDQAAGITVGFPSQEGLTGEATFNRFEDNFNPALGFANRTGIDQTAGEISYNRRPDTGRFQSIVVRAQAEHFQDSSGNLQSELIGVVPFDLTTNIGDRIFMRSNFIKEVLVEPFEIYPGVVLPPGEYVFENHGVAINAAGFRKLSGQIAYREGTFWGGTEKRLWGDVTWVPSPRFRANIGYDITRAEIPQGDFTTRLLTGGIDYIFSNELSWVNLIQYDNVSETLGINMRLQWIPVPGQEVFFVVNHNMEDRDRDNRFRSLASTVTAKFSYTFRY